MNDVIRLAHCVEGCECEPDRCYVFRVIGHSFQVERPRCRWLCSNAPTRDCADYLQEVTGYTILHREQLERFLERAFSFDGAPPVDDFWPRSFCKFGTEYFVLREVVKLLPDRKHCLVCQSRCEGAIQADVRDTKKRLVCSKQCLWILKNYSTREKRWKVKQSLNEVQLILNQQATDKEVRRELRPCWEQLKACRRYIRTGDLEAFTSLPKEFRPAATLPT